MAREFHNIACDFYNSFCFGVILFIYNVSFNVSFMHVSTRQIYRERLSIFR